MDLLVIVNENSDIVHSQHFNHTTEIEQCRLILLAYGSIDVINDLVYRTRENYFDCIDSHLKHDISVHIFPCFYKAIFVHTRKKNTKRFLNDVHSIFVKFVIDKMVEDSRINKSILHEEIEASYKEYF